MLNNNLIMASYIRGYILNNNIQFDKEILDKDLASLTSSEIEKLKDFAIKKELKLYYFKEKEILPRVKIVLGYLKGIYPETLLDVGSGRGIFLFPLLKEFPNIKVHSIDILDKRFELLNNISTGGIANLVVDKKDITTYYSLTPLYDCVTLLEVLEHIPNVEGAIKNAISLSKKFIIISVPNKPDNNPEHIHFLTIEKLTNIFNSFGITNLKFSGVNGHLILVAQK